MSAMLLLPTPVAFSVARSTEKSADVISATVAPLTTRAPLTADISIGDHWIH